MPEEVSKQLRHYRNNSEKICKDRRDLYRTRRSSGLCTKCGQPVIEGKSYCKKHYESYLNALDKQNTINALGRKVLEESKGESVNEA